jgi:hypothetical protein
MIYGIFLLYGMMHYTMGDGCQDRGSDEMLLLGVDPPHAFTTASS